MRMTTSLLSCPRAPHRLRPMDGPRLQLAQVVVEVTASRHPPPLVTGVAPVARALVSRPSVVDPWVVVVVVVAASEVSPLVWRLRRCSHRSSLHRHKKWWWGHLHPHVVGSVGRRGGGALLLNSDLVRTRWARMSCNQRGPNRACTTPSH